MVERRRTCPHGMLRDCLDCAVPDPLPDPVALAPIPEWEPNDYLPLGLLLEKDESHPPIELCLLPDHNNKPCQLARWHDGVTHDGRKLDGPDTNRGSVKSPRSRS